MKTNSTTYLVGGMALAGFSFWLAQFLKEKKLKKPNKKRPEFDVVDIASEDSFPASDAPSWTRGPAV